MPRSCHTKNNNIPRFTARSCRKNVYLCGPLIKCKRAMQNRVGSRSLITRGTGTTKAAEKVRLKPCETFSLAGSYDHQICARRESCERVTHAGTTRNANLFSSLNVNSSRELRVVRRRRRDCRKFVYRFRRGRKFPQKSFH